LLSGSPNGIRIRVSALRGPCPRPLDDGAKPAQFRPRPTASVRSRDGRLWWRLTKQGHGGEPRRSVEEAADSLSSLDNRGRWLIFGRVRGGRARKGTGTPQPPGAPRYRPASLGTSVRRNWGPHCAASSSLASPKLRGATRSSLESIRAPTPKAPAALGDRLDAGASTCPSIEGLGSQARWQSPAAMVSSAT
jgi:hypothetical protein